LVAVGDEQFPRGIQNGPADRGPVTFLSLFYAQVIDTLWFSWIYCGRGEQCSLV
jgi:hypothetical protein